jgi:hypothetical protein
MRHAGTVTPTETEMQEDFMENVATLRVIL